MVSIATATRNVFNSSYLVAGLLRESRNQRSLDFKHPFETQTQPSHPVPFLSKHRPW